MAQTVDGPGGGFCNHEYVDITTMGDSMQKFECFRCGSREEKPMAQQVLNVWSTGDMGLSSPMYATTEDAGPSPDAYERLAVKLAGLEAELAAQKEEKLVAPIIPPMSHHREVDL